MSLPESPDLDAQLATLRGTIDGLDAELLRLLSQRAQCAQQIGHLKGSGVVYRPEREAQVLRRIMAKNPGPLADAAVGRLFREIMSACLALERPLKVAFLGPAGTFSQAAAEKHFGGSAAAVPYPNIDDVVRAVEAGQADYAVVPVENSTEGAVGRTLDLMLESPLQVCGEVELRIHQNLMGRMEQPSDITRIYSHAQSLAQTQHWLNANYPTVPRIAVASNAEAARLASEDPTAAAIAGEIAATRYELTIFAQNIEDNPNNTTRFWVLGAQKVPPSGRDKTSLVMSALNRPGAVYSLLQPLADHGVSMTKFESRPAQSRIWEYVFFVDVEGHQDDANVAAAVAKLRERTMLLKLLGSYPKAAI